MLDLVIDILGNYTPQAGDGIASLNIPWIIGAILFILCVWFVFKLVLRLIERTTRR